MIDGLILRVDFDLFWICYPVGWLKLKEIIGGEETFHQNQTNPARTVPSARPSRFRPIRYNASRNYLFLVNYFDCFSWRQCHKIQGVGL